MEDAVIAPLVKFVRTTLSVPEVAERVAPALVILLPSPLNAVALKVPVEGSYTSAESVAALVMIPEVISVSATL